MKDHSIRTLSHECYVSTTTVIRFVRKLGFDGYSDFINLLRLTDFSIPEPQMPQWVSQNAYIEKYVNNVVESLRIVSSDKIARFENYLKRGPQIFLLADGLCAEVAAYARHLFMQLGFIVFSPVEPYEIKSAIHQITSDDLLWVISITGQDKETINTMERMLADKRPTLISITGLSNNVIESSSDINFYTFSSPNMFMGGDISSCAPMLAVVEILAHSWLAKKQEEAQEKRLNLPLPSNQD